MQLVSKITLATFHFNKQTFNNKVIVARCLGQYRKYFPRFSYFAVILNKLQNKRNAENISHSARGNVR